MPTIATCGDMNRRRLDAESIHDAVLRISGKLDPKMGGPSVKQFHLSKGIHVTPNVDYVNFDPDDPGKLPPQRLPLSCSAPCPTRFRKPWIAPTARS